jgi:hypothetical protein
MFLFPLPHGDGVLCALDGVVFGIGELCQAANIRNLSLGLLVLYQSVSRDDMIRGPFGSEESNMCRAALEIKGSQDNFGMDFLSTNSDKPLNHEAVDLG